MTTHMLKVQRTITVFSCT